VDILDDFPKEEKFMEDERATELYELMRKVQAGAIDLKNYYRRLAVFWEEEGFPEWANEAKAKIRD
tara:strand:+ start:274 stop:471 length:198 start_codon:yes stop_codon:yes gene_type:complete